MSNGGLAMMAAIEHLNISKPSGLSCEPITRVLRYQVPGTTFLFWGTVWDRSQAFLTHFSSPHHH